MGETKSQFLARIGQQAGERGRAAKYDLAHCDMVKRLAQGGKFPETWACEIGVSVETLRRWGHTYPEFRDALIIAKHLLGHYWTERVAEATNKPNTNSAMYALLMRRLPALFGREPVDLTEYVLQPDSGEETDPVRLKSDQISVASTEDLLARLEVLGRRREVEKG